MSTKNRHVLTIVGEYFENGMHCSRLTTYDLPYKPLFMINNFTNNIPLIVICLIDCQLIKLCIA